MAINSLRMEGDKLFSIPSPMFFISDAVITNASISDAIILPASIWETLRRFTLKSPTSRLLILVRSSENRAD
ncbi:hypothetical protein WN48_10012 [Eufriesea mexicana]|uniref:Uncharacterized protein n=1 Tax=Eufriesea mexicana TaxID=516756 RepID=A0A310SEN8_9HYME|nr:hypothetical protein WN48_10012 [Eufriesea mexicana]